MPGVFCPQCSHRNVDGANFCTSCGSVTRVSDAQLGQRAEALAISNGFIAVRHRLVVYGLCALCNADRGGPRAHDVRILS